jgi:PAS domain S-box-containing protein
MSVGEQISADPACRRVLDQLVALVRVWTPAEGVIYVNRAWRDLTGTTLEDNLGEGWLRAVHAEDRATLLLAFGSTTGAAHADYRLTTHEGQTVAVRDTPSPWVDEHSDGIVEVVHTITTKDIASGSVQTMSRWAHELRGPLNAILGWSDLLGSGESDLEVMQRGLKAIANNARQQALIIKRMSD